MNLAKARSILLLSLLIGPMLLIGFFATCGQLIADDEHDKDRSAEIIIHSGGTSPVAVKINDNRFKLLTPVGNKMSATEKAKLRNALKIAFVDVAEERFHVRLNKEAIEKRVDEIRKIQDDNALALTFTVLSEDKDKIRRTLEASLRSAELDKAIERKIAESDSQFKTFIDGNNQQALSIVQADIQKKFEAHTGKAGILYKRFIVNKWWKKFYREADVDTEDRRVREVLEILKTEGDFSASFFDKKIAALPTPYAPRRVYP